MVSKINISLNFETIRCSVKKEGGAYFKVSEMGNIKCISLVIFSFKIRIKQIFTINKSNIMKKSKYQQNFYCLIVCILISYAF